MIDWRRAERHARLHRIASWVRIVLVIAMADEVYSAIRYHFPLWDDIAMPVTLLLHSIAGFIQKHTEMYRADL